MSDTGENNQSSLAGRKGCAAVFFWKMKGCIARYGWCKLFPVRYGMVWYAHSSFGKGHVEPTGLSHSPPNGSDCVMPSAGISCPLPLWEVITELNGWSQSLHSYIQHYGGVPLLGERSGPWNRFIQGILQTFPKPLRILSSLRALQEQDTGRKGQYIEG